MSEGRLQAAVIGLGRHGLRHLQAYRNLSAVEVAAVCDLNAEAVRSAIQNNPQIKGYSDWRELLERETLDVISVVTNGPTHAPITIAAAESGVRRILCEKPIANSVADARAAIRACETHGVRLSISHGRRWVTEYQRLRSLIADGLIGTPNHFWVTCGGGLFGGNGTHFMDLARMLCQSDPVSVIAVLDQTGTPNPRGEEFKDPGAIALYHFNNGMRMVIDMCEDIQVPQRIEIVGTRGRILIDEMEGRCLIWSREEQAAEVGPGNWWDPLVAQPFEQIPLDMFQMLRSAISELLSDDRISCTGRDGLASLEMVIGAHASSLRGGSRVTFPLSGPDRELNVPFT